MGFSWVALVSALAVIMPLLFLLFFDELPVLASVVLGGLFTIMAFFGWLTQIDPYLPWVQPVTCSAALFVTALQAGMWLSNCPGD